MENRNEKVLHHAFIRVNQKAQKLIQEKAVDKETMKWLLLKELIKEQLPNENPSNTTR